MESTDEADIGRDSIDRGGRSGDSGTDMHFCSRQRSLCSWLMHEQFLCMYHRAGRRMSIWSCQKK